MLMTRRERARGEMYEDRGGDIRNFTEAHSVKTEEFSAECLPCTCAMRRNGSSARPTLG